MTLEEAAKLVHSTDYIAMIRGVMSECEKLCLYEVNSNKKIDIGGVYYVKDNLVYVYIYRTSICLNRQLFPNYAGYEKDIAQGFSKHKCSIITYEPLSELRQIMLKHGYEFK